ncbi:hypothetical protein Asi02nite_75230 [Asanoa siamensis]|uniref:Uncharacterized protein n=1 Tax=Asanoa siamensis TaxID=926357 RepID=A0ABQ4D391_9ACTN|nr:hypothetical protein Asi02nite_75230 [Asanoa siamensis]
MEEPRSEPLPLASTKADSAKDQASPARGADRAVIAPPSFGGQQAGQEPDAASHISSTPGRDRATEPVLSAAAGRPQPRSATQTARYARDLNDDGPDYTGSLLVRHAFWATIHLVR